MRAARWPWRARLLIVVLLLSLVSCGGSPTITYTSAAPSAAPVTWDFDGSERLPEGAEVFAGQWVVRSEAGAPSRPNALCQVGNAQFPAILLPSMVYGDLTATARFKPISGREDQAAGIIFRVQGKDDYYILRANALEGNVNLYRYVGGARSVIKEAAAAVAVGTWYELRIEATGDRLRGFLDGKLVVESSDATFKAGRVGLWTKADSVSCFDDVTVTAGNP